jgi:hypothetical protein
MQIHNSAQTTWHCCDQASFPIPSAIWISGHKPAAKLQILLSSVICLLTSEMLQTAIPVNPEIIPAANDPRL